MNDQELQAQQRDVQRLLGRYLLRLQQYERLMKAIVAHHDLSGPAHALENIRAARIDDASKKTLGTLVGQLFGSCVVTEGADSATDTTENEPENVPFFAMRLHPSLSAEDYVRTQSDLKELVLLRNSLVHHFIDQHDLWSTDRKRGQAQFIAAIRPALHRLLMPLRRVCVVCHACAAPAAVRS